MTCHSRCSHIKTHVDAKSMLVCVLKVWPVHFRCCRAGNHKVEVLRMFSALCSAKNVQLAASSACRLPALLEHEALVSILFSAKWSARVEHFLHTSGYISPL